MFASECLMSESVEVCLNAHPKQGRHEVATWPYGHGWGSRDPNKKESVNDVKSLLKQVEQVV